jgi:peptidoglycan/xylan/chitin deacetylase (PgdA/CDA1 family)
MKRQHVLPSAAGALAILVLGACSGATTDNPGSITPDGGAGTDAPTGGGDDAGPGGGDDAPSGDDAGGAGVAGNGCAGGACQNPQCKALTTAEDPGMYPQIGFETQPTYIPNDTIVPTFDDVPDGANSPPDPIYGSGSWTKLDLQFFAANHMHVDFFINTNNWCGDVTMDEECTADIAEILSLHNPGNHTIHHVHMGTAPTMTSPPDGCADAASCDAELKGVETLVGTMSKGARPHLTRFRAPYGEPYQAQGAGLGVVQPVVAKYAVEVGWNLDSGDSSGQSTGMQIASNVEGLVGSGPGQGSWGILLMHGTFPWTHDALPLLFGPSGYLTKKGFKLATVEDVICWKFGKHSWEIVQQVSGQPRKPN